MKICTEHVEAYGKSDYCPICSYALENDLLKSSIKELNIKLLKAMESSTSNPQPKTTSGPAIELPKYKCYKEVWALKIVDMSFDGYLRFDPPYAPIFMSPEWIEKYRPEVGGYYVVYKDGYNSYSPAKAFEEGYARM